MFVAMFSLKPPALQQVVHGGVSQYVTGSRVYAREWFANDLGFNVGHIHELKLNTDTPGVLLVAKDRSTMRKAIAGSPAMVHAKNLGVVVALAGSYHSALNSAVVKRAMIDPVRHVASAVVQKRRGLPFGRQGGTDMHRDRLQDRGYAVILSGHAQRLRTPPGLSYITTNDYSITISQWAERMTPA